MFSKQQSMYVCLFCAGQVVSDDSKDVASSFRIKNNKQTTGHPLHFFSLSLQVPHTRQLDLSVTQLTILETSSPQHPT